MQIIVASQNPVKIQAAQAAFSQMFPEREHEVLGISVASEVPDQPMGNEETLKGAIGRVKNAREEKADAAFWVGMEGGLIDIGDTFAATAWFVVEDKAGLRGKSRAATFELPAKLADLVREGKEFGHASDEYFGKNDLSHKNGTVGFLTRDNVTRTSYYTHPLICALIPFVHSRFYS